MSVNDIKHLAVETIYLVPDSSEGQRCYLWCDDPAPGLDMDPSDSVEYLRKDVHDAIIAKQASAAKQGMDAAKKVAGSNLEQAKRLHAESSPAALESEREANARLTELVAKLEQERDALAAHVERQSELLRRLVSAMRNYEMDADPDYPPPRDHRAMMSDAEAALKAVPVTSLARRDSHPDCELECGAYGTYCKCAAEKSQQAAWDKEEEDLKKVRDGKMSTNTFRRIHFPELAASSKTEDHQ